MTHRSSVATASALLLALSLHGAAARAAAGDEAEPSPLLAFYDFEKPTASGPDTFWVRERGESAVDLSAAFRYAGERSLRLHEVAGNGDFVEFLAYFPVRTSGSVFVQFYVLFAEVGERFNFGLAGSGWFLHQGQHGHAVWLQTAAGSLRHQPAEGWEDLLAVRPFVWYFVDLAYHVDAGRYDLAIWEEGRDEPLLDLRGKRAFCDADASSVRFASLIGDLEDEGSFDVFVDQFLVGSHPSVRLAPFVAPGRRRLFVDHLATAAPPPASASRGDLLALARRHLRALPGDGAPSAELADALEGMADAAIRSRQLALAARLLEPLRRSADYRRSTRAMLKLSDVYHLSGDRAAERAMREAIYGRLTYEETGEP